MLTGLKEFARLIWMTLESLLSYGHHYHLQEGHIMDMEFRTPKLCCYME